MTKLIDLSVDGYYVLVPHKMPEFHPSSRQPPLEKLQELVGGFIQVVYIGKQKAHGIVDEEGKIRGKAFNPLASALYGNPHDPIVGTMVVCCGKARLK